MDACAEADLVEGSPLIVTAGGRQLVVVRWHGEVHALRNICPHQNQSFECGAVRERIVARERGEMEPDFEDPILICPFHGWEFQLTSGRCTSDPGLRVKRYPARIEGGRVLVEI